LHTAGSHRTGKGHADGTVRYQRAGRVRALRKLSQESNIKLIDIAAKLVQGERPAE
jgi:hypothetical protein